MSSKLMRQAKKFLEATFNTSVTTTTTTTTTATATTTTATTTPPTTTIIITSTTTTAAATAVPMSRYISQLFPSRQTLTMDLNSLHFLEALNHILLRNIRCPNSSVYLDRQIEGICACTPISKLKSLSLYIH